MQNKLISSRLVILVGFISILILLAALISVSLFSIFDNSHRLKNIVAEKNRVTDIFTMRDSAQARALMLYRMMAITDPFERDDVYMNFKDQAEIFIKARNSLLADKNAYEQQKAWQAVRPFVRKGNLTQNKTVEIIFDGDYQKANALLVSEVIPTQDIVAIGFTRMLNIQNKTVNDQLKVAQNQNNQLYLSISLLGITVLLIGILITIYVYLHNKNTESILNSHQNMAESANRAKSAFLASMSHEIRTPLTSIIGFSEQLLNKHLQEDDKEKIQNTIIRNSKHLLRIINDTLDLSKIEAGQLDVELTATSAIQIITETQSTLAKQASDKGLSFGVAYDFPIPSSIITDPIRLKQILINLCGNAIKFTHQGEIQLHCKFDKESNLIIFSVIDSGIGMAKNVQEKIFRPFVQSDSSTTRNYGGTGLGLSISSLLAEKLGGTLSCFSVENKGSRFVLSLNTGISGNIKMIEALQSAVPQADVTFDNTKIRKLKGKILLAEDTEDNQDLIKMYVNQTGAEIDIVDNGVDAVNSALKGQYNLVLMDVQMPKMDGLSAIKKLRQAGYEAPIISLTANALSSDKNACLEAGASFFLAKPIIQSQFYDALNFYLDENLLQPQANENTRQNPYPEIAIEVTNNPRMNSLKEKFIENLPQILHELNLALNEKDRDKVAGVSHRLKGIGTSFGFPEITHLSAQINNSAKHESWSKTIELIESLDNFCKNIIA